LIDPFPDDEALVAALRAGDQRAWNTFVARYERLVYAVPRRMGIDAAEASDVLQDVFVAFLRGLPRLRDARTVPRWLTRTAFRIARQRRARRRREAPAEDPGIFAAIAGDSDLAELCARAEDAARARRSLATLGGRCEELLTLLFLSEPPLAYREIAARLGTPVGSLGPTRRRCLERLLEQMGEGGDGERIRDTPRSTLQTKSRSAARTRRTR
jgi:RNA polymerase sigma factor (sigma-70 family)